MTRFTLRGVRGAHAAAVTWEDGDLSGDPDAVALVRHLAETFEGHPAGQLGGPYTVTHHLVSPYTACAFMRLVFSNRPTLDGALPRLPDPPPGAVG